MMSNRIKFFVVVISCCFSFIGYAIQVEEQVWGFDGRVVKNAINPVSFLITNMKGKPFEGTVTLECEAWNNRIGAPLVKKVYLGAFKTKWIQFYPYITESRRNWTFSSSEPGSNPITFPEVNFTNGTTVYLKSVNSLQRKKMRVKSFNENLFPVSTSLLVGLNGIVMDHEPDWSPLQQQAFKRWLYRGGTLYLFKTDSSEDIVFTEALSFLNGKKSYGGGIIKRYDQTVFNLTYQTLGLPKRKKNVNDDDSEDALSNVYFNEERTIFGLLRTLVKTDHNWFVIYMFIVAYIVCIGPINYIIGRKTRDYRITLGFFVIVVVIFSLTFSYIGRRGYGEETVVNDLTLARYVGEGVYDITQYTDLFVTKGDYYRVTYPSNYAVFSSCARGRVNGVITTGKNGAYQIDIPLFSSQSALFCGECKLNGEPLLTAVENDNHSISLSLKNIGDIDSIYTVYCCYRNKIYKLSSDSLSWKLNRSNGIKDKEFCKNLLSSIDRYYEYRRLQKPELVEIQKKLLGVFIYRDLRLRDYFSQRDNSDRVTIYLLAKTPKGFQNNSEKLKTQRGYTMFSYSTLVKHN
jgi:hypothetical protein